MQNFEGRLLQKTWSNMYHHYGMFYIWTFIIDLTVILALYKYRPLWMYVHIFFGFCATLLTLLFTLPILRQNGIPQQQNPFKMQRHSIIGTVILATVTLQFILGTVAGVIKLFRRGSTFGLYAFTGCHKYLGYALLILAKVQVYMIVDHNGNHPTLWRIVLALESILFACFVVIKIWFPTMSSQIMPKYEQNKYRKIQSVKELKFQQNQPVGVFANYVYDLSSLLINHPAGYRIIEGIQHRDFDRYLYGMYRSQRQAIIPEHSHSYKALTIVGEPIAKLNIPQLFKNIERDYCDVALRRVTNVSEKGQIYQLELQSSAAPFEYLGYRDVRQLGRFYSLTLDKKVTRLYTSAGFLDAKNVKFMENDVFSRMGLKEVSQWAKLAGEESGKSNKLVLMIKKYETGLLTKQVVAGNSQEKHLQLSCLRGQGLRFAELKPGRIIIVAGGTGLYPFSDLIDLLFKSLLLKTRPELKKVLLDHDPLLGSNPFDNFSFSLYLAVGNLEDIHPITLLQLNQLSKHPKLLKLMLKISSRKKEAAPSVATEMNELSNQNIKMSQGGHLNENILYTSQRFSSVLRQILSTEEYERIWVCGPPPMNEQIVHLFDQLNIERQKYIML